MGVPRTGRFAVAAPLTSPPSSQDDGGGGHTAAPAPVDRSRRDTTATPHGHATDTSVCCHDVMTTPRVLRPLPDRATVVDVHGSRFLLEWLDRDTLADAAETARRRDDLPEERAAS
ncbi:hypothetical protein GCM10027451_32410 [Geodermatophilus aquaeductus]|uniref:Uncharacterized protein n=2 Tax=Geodermatophilus aquaeductus TaxID=1564161 RepID=A0A521EZ61_9ACTN|nr:hypothetical protein SAMN06273567_106196 [Geodermatophilus aquaeductus]